MENVVALRNALATHHHPHDDENERNRFANVADAGDPRVHEGLDHTHDEASQQSNRERAEGCDQRDRGCRQDEVAEYARAQADIGLHDKDCCEARERTTNGPVQDSDGVRRPTQ